jgi:hypothetical protein
MARNRSTSTPSATRARRQDTRRNRQSGRKTSAQAADEAAPAAAAIFEAPARLASVWTQFAGQVQRAAQQTLQGLQHDAEIESEALQRASSPQQLVGLPIEMVAEQVARWAQLSAQLAGSLLDVQTAWFKDIESVAAQLMSPWFTRNGRIAFGSAQDIVEPPTDPGPAPLLWSAQRIWSESAKAWLQAMSHDVQAEPAAR